MQTGGMPLRIWVETEFHRERKRTSQNNLKMGISVALNSETVRGFLATVFWKHGQEEYRKAEIIKIQQRDFALDIDREKEVGDSVK